MSPESASVLQGARQALNTKWYAAGATFSLGVGLADTEGWGEGKSQKYEHDQSVLDPGCDCTTCTAGTHAHIYVI